MGGGPGAGGAERRVAGAMQDWITTLLPSADRARQAAAHDQLADAKAVCIVYFTKIDS